jgi:uncharacterized protein (DUF1778 family)
MPPVAAVMERAEETEPKTKTINVRVSEQTRELIDMAAAFVGKSRSEFMLESARQHAIDVLLDQRLFVLEKDKYDAFVRALQRRDLTAQANG